jgi:hypothetical protein
LEELEITGSLLTAVGAEHCCGNGFMVQHHPPRVKRIVLVKHLVQTQVLYQQY